MSDITEQLREEIDELTDALEMITAENKQMREALQEIIKLDDEWKPETLDDYSGIAYEHCGNIARTALGIKK